MGEERLRRGNSPIAGGARWMIIKDFSDSEAGAGSEADADSQQY